MRDMVPVGQSLWLAMNNNELKEISNLDGTLLNTYSLGFEPRGIAFDGTNLLLISPTTLYKYDLDGSEVSTVTLESAAGGTDGMVFNAGFLWLNDDGSGSARKVDTNDGSLIQEIIYEDSPGTTTQGIAVLARFFYVPIFDNSSLARFAPDGNFEAQIDLGSQRLRGININADRSFWILNYVTHEIFLYEEPDGFFIQGPPTPAQIFGNTFADVSGRDPLPTALNQRTPARNLANYNISMYLFNPQIIIKPVQINLGELSLINPAPSGTDIARLIWFDADPRDPHFKVGRWAQVLGRSGSADPGTVELELRICDNPQSFMPPS